MPTLKEIEERARRDREQERHAKRDLYAGLYGVFLRQHGFSADEAAALVMARYPHTRERLKNLARRADEERIWRRHADPYEDTL